MLLRIHRQFTALGLSVMLSYRLPPHLQDRRERYSANSGIRRRAMKIQRVLANRWSPIYVDSRVTQGLEAPPRTSTSHLATDHGSRPPAAQSRSELSLATRSGPRTMEATCGNGYVPVRGMPAMMMMMMMMMENPATKSNGKLTNKRIAKGYRCVWKSYCSKTPVIYGLMAGVRCPATTWYSL